ncbi:MAG: UDP-glucose 4-epimerase GalE [Chloroflexi bacterium]|nr:UDP-glucose 4-epimerase GalE [Chloroflexota bacterium]
MKVLVTGAAGYIGSVVTDQLVEQGHQVIGFDSLKAGHRAAVNPKAEFFQGDLLDLVGCKALLKAKPVDAVVHLAAEALVDVSMRDPGLFFQVNVTGGINLLEAMVEAGVKRIVFSSTAAVYGEPKQVPIAEDDPREPVNPYGESKLAFERMMEWYRRAHGLNYVTLRYFNACGATERYGEFHDPETHIIPVLFDVALGQRKEFRLFGTDYDTPDGSCVRDYIHVADIARAHLLALGAIDRIGARAYNMGNRLGYSNAQVVEEVRRVTGRPIPVVPSARRPGDPARLVASSDRIRNELSWTPQYPDLSSMVETAWAWRQKHPHGYEA